MYKRSKVLATGIIVFFLTTIFAVSFSSAQSTPSTFGAVNVGSQNAVTFGGVLVSNFTSPSDLANITAIKAYLASGGTKARAVIYADNGSVPGILLAESAQIDIGGTSGEWINFNLSYDGIPDTIYWLGIVLDSASSYNYAENVTGKGLCSGPLSDTINPFPSPISVSNNVLSVYALYSLSTALPQSDQTQNWIAIALILIAIAGVAVAIVLTVVIFIHGRKK
jgi:hypothetical protein